MPRDARSWVDRFWVEDAGSWGTKGLCFLSIIQLMWSETEFETVCHDPAVTSEIHLEKAPADRQWRKHEKTAVRQERFQK